MGNAVKCASFGKADRFHEHTSGERSPPYFHKLTSGVMQISQQSPSAVQRC
jgi:hypothetical protein